jgi:hypothetical protein
VLQQMKLVVVGGQARKVGKTSIIAGIIRRLNSLAWVAVKITHHGGEGDLPDPQSAESIPAHLNFFCREEKDPRARRDTSRFLAAGAQRSFWLRVREGKLAEALPALFEALDGNERVIIESNSIMDLLKPAIFLLVMAESQHELKASARRLAPRADALVAVLPGPRASTRISPDVLHDKPVFPILMGEWSTPALCRFVRERLASADEQEIRLVRPSPSPE